MVLRVPFRPGVSNLFHLRSDFHIAKRATSCLFLKKYIKLWGPEVGPMGQFQHSKSFNDVALEMLILVKSICFINI